MALSTFEDLANCYEAMIDWPKRLAHEAPFYRRCSSPVRPARARRGLRHRSPRGIVSFLGITGRRGRHQRVDAGACARNFGQPAGLQWTRRGYSDPMRNPTGLFDVVVCVGNSLALAPDLQTAALR